MPAPSAPSDPPLSSTARHAVPDLKDAFLKRIKTERPPAYMSVLAQARTIEVAADRMSLTFSESQKIGPAFEKYRTLFEQVAADVFGRRIAVVADVRADDSAAENAAGDRQAAAKKAALREQALADSGVQAMLEVFPAEIRDVEEM
jgi:hypothetical protein